MGRTQVGVQVRPTSAIVCCSSSSTSRSVEDALRRRQQNAHASFPGNDHDHDDGRRRDLEPGGDDRQRQRDARPPPGSSTVAGCLERTAAEVPLAVLPPPRSSHFLTRRIGRESGTRHITRNRRAARLVRSSTVGGDKHGVVAFPSAQRLRFR